MTTAPVFDAHVDSLQRMLDLGHDLGTETPGHLDLVRGARGGLGAVVCVCWCDPCHMESGGEGARRRTARLLGSFHELAAAHPDRMGWAGNGSMMDRIRSEGRIAGIPGIEGGHSIEEDLGHLESFFLGGVRVMTLVWNNHLSWIRSCQDGAGAGVPEGLSPFGHQVVRRMNELGMVVDLSHAGERSFYDALGTSERPVIASHSGCHALNDHPRNLSDDQLRALGDAGGVVGIVFCTPFLDADARRLENEARETEVYSSLQGACDSELFVRQGDWLQENLPPLGLDRVADHVLHAIEVAGVDHVGIGSDFDGIQRRPAGLEDASCYPALAALLEERGLTRDEVKAVLWGNMARVFREVTGPGSEAAQLEIADAHVASQLAAP